jgi:hypothetical protein
MQDLSILKEFLRNIHEQQSAMKKVAQGHNPHITSQAAAKYTRNAVLRGKSPVEGLVHGSEAAEFDKDFGKNRIN